MEEEETSRPIMESNIQRPKENEDEQQEEYSAQEEEESPVNHNTNGNHKSNETNNSSRSENPTADPQGVVVEVGSSGTSSPAAAAAVTGSGVAGEGDVANTTTLAARITITEDDPKLQSDMSSLTPDEIEYFLWPLFSSSSDLNSRGDQNGSGSGAGDGTLQRGGNITLEELRSMNERDDDFYHAFRGLSDEEELKSQVNFKQRIVIGIGAFCWLISWGWTIMFWVLKGVSNPSCINPFDDSGEVSFLKFQETWNFCYLAWFPMSCVTFSPQFPFFGGMLLIAGGFFRMKLALFAISLLTLFGCLAGWILMILAFAYKFPPIYPLIFAFHLLLLTVGGVVVTLLIPSVTKIEAAEEEKRELRKLCKKKWEGRKAGKQE